jgi:RNA polymerase sigma-70 factor (ECF subfamily)
LRRCVKIGATSPTDAWNWDDLLSVALRETSRMLRERHDAEDAAQEAVIRAFRSRARCATPEAPHAWMRTIARREALRLYARRRDSSELTGEEPAVGAEDAVVSVVERLAAQTALRHVPIGDRSLLMRRYVLEQSSGEIADALSMPAATVRVRLHRASKRLRDELGSWS